MSDISSLEYYLSDADIKRLLKGKTKIIRYSDLHKYRSLDQLLKPYGHFIILYEMKKHMGHWSLVMKTGTNKVEFFDSYGKKPDDALDWINENVKDDLNEDHTYLINLLMNSGYKIEFNHTPLQSKDPRMATCGKHCVVRLLMKDLSLAKYAKMMKSDKNLTPDEIVNDIILWLSKKII